MLVEQIKEIVGSDNFILIAGSIILDEFKKGIVSHALAHLV